MMSRIHTIFAALLLAVPLFTACGDNDEGTGPDATPDGEYVLAKVNGEVPPVTIAIVEYDGATFEASLREGSLDLRSGRYVLTLRVFGQFDGEDSIGNTHTDMGSYTVDGTSITFRSDTVEDEAVTGTIHDGQITLSEELEEYGSLSLVFEAR